MKEKSEKALKSIFKGGAIIFIGIMASKFLALMYRVIVGRYIGPEEYGIITVMIAVFSAGTTLSYMGLNKGVQKYVAEYRGQKDEEAIRGTVRAGLRMTTVSSLLVASILILMAPWLSNNVFNEPRLLIPLRLAAIAIPFRVYGRILRSVTEAYEQMQYKVYIDYLGVNIAKIILTVMLIALSYGLVGAAFAYTLSFALSIFFAYYYVQKVAPGILKDTNKTKTNYQELFSHSWPLLIAGMFGIITSHIDTFMIQGFLESRQVGLYNAAYPFAALIGIGSTMFSSIFLSNASKLAGNNNIDEMNQSYRATVKWITITAVPIFLVLVAFPRTALSFFGSDYYAVENVLRILAIGYLFNALIGPAKGVYQAFSLTKIILALSVIVSALNISLNYLLIPRLGVIGAAYSSTISLTVVVLLKLAILYYLTRTQPFRRSTFNIILAGLFAIGIVYGTTNLLFTTTPIWFFPIALVAYGILYLTFLILFKTVEEDDMVVFKAIEEKLGVETQIFRKLANHARRN